jgi:hypothetical protein
MTLILFTSSMVVHLDMAGPDASVMSKSMPIPGKGVRMSENRMHPSVWYARHGCKLYIVNELRL